MKKILAIFALGLTVIILSCSKTELINNQFKTINLNSQLNQSNKSNFYNSITISDVNTFEDMLHFKDFKAYRKALEDLENFQNADIIAFNQLYLVNTLEEIALMSEVEQDDLSQQLEDIESSIGFSETGIYEQFENQLNFTSLRRVIEQEEAIFLNNSNPNWELDPDNHFILFDEDRTLFNPFSEIKIGTSIYKITEDFIYEITDGNYTTLLALRNNGYSTEMNNVKKTDNDNSEGSVEDNTSTNGNNGTSGNSGTSGSNGTNNPTAGNQNSTSSSCKQTRHKWNYKNNSNDTKRIKWKVAINSWWDNKIYAETTNYKKKNNGTWIKYKATAKSDVYGELCDSPQTVLTTSTLSITQDFKKKVKDSYTVVNKHVDNGKLKGYHYGVGGITYTNTLTW